MITLEEFMGGGRLHNPLSANITLVAGSPRLRTLVPNGSRDVTLPDARLLKLGWPQFILLNIDGTNTVTVKDANGNAVHSLGPNSSVLLGLAEQNDAAGRWTADGRGV